MSDGTLPVKTHSGANGIVSEQGEHTKILCPTKQSKMCVPRSCHRRATSVARNSELCGTPNVQFSVSVMVIMKYGLQPTMAVPKTSYMETLLSCFLLGRLDVF